MLDISLKYFSKYMTVIYNMSIDRADKPWIGDRRLTEMSDGLIKPDEGYALVNIVL